MRNIYECKYKTLFVSNNTQSNMSPIEIIDIFIAHLNSWRYLEILFTIIIQNYIDDKSAARPYLMH